MTKEKKIITITDGRLWKSVLSDLFTYGAAVAMIGLGWLLESAAMQWFGFVVVCLGLLGRASMETIPKFTAQEAADHLLEVYGVRAKKASKTEPIKKGWHYEAEKHYEPEGRKP